MILLFVSSVVSATENNLPELRERLERVANENQTRLVVTAYAHNELESVGIHTVDSFLLSEEIVHGWRILYSGDENIEKIINGYQENHRVWSMIFNRAAMQDTNSLLKVNMLGADLSAINQTMSQICGVNLVLSVSAGKIPITIIDSKGERAEDLCQDYMLFLSASGVKVKHALNYIIGVDK